jgi:hypothetical protein
MTQLHAATANNSALRLAAFCSTADHIHKDPKSHRDAATLSFLTGRRWGHSRECWLSWEAAKTEQSYPPDDQRGAAATAVTTAPGHDPGHVPDEALLAVIASAHFGIAARRLFRWE